MRVVELLLVVVVDPVYGYLINFLAVFLVGGVVCVVDGVVVDKYIYFRSTIFFQHLEVSIT